MNDLLFAVKGAGAGAGAPPPSRPPPGGAAAAAAAAAASGAAYDLEAGVGGPGAAAAGARGRDLEAFFASVEGVKADLTDIQARQRGIAALHERGKTIVRQKEMRRHQDDMQASVNAVASAAARAKAKIEALDRDNAAALARPGQGQGSASERARTGVTTGLKRRLKDLMAEFGGLRAR